MGGDVPYQLGANDYGITGGAFLAKSPMGATTVVLDETQVGKICLKGTVEMVPTPPDGSHPPYSQYWGIDLGFNLNQAADATAASEKTPWTVPPGVVGFWFTVEGAFNVGTVRKAPASRTSVRACWTLACKSRPTSMPRNPSTFA